jgi:hypothetical protein
MKNNLLNGKQKKDQRTNYDQFIYTID